MSEKYYLDQKSIDTIIVVFEDYQRLLNQILLNGTVTLDKKWAIFAISKLAVFISQLKSTY
jgi:hypothetical protein